MKPFVTDQVNSDQILVQPADLEEMFSSLFDSMLMLPVELSSSGCQPDLDFLTASIEVTGDWQAELHIAVDQPLSQSIACAMFGMEPDELAEDEVYDALCEVVNVVGGNVKGMVNLDCQLSLPKVGNLEWATGDNGLKVDFESEGNQMSALLQIRG